MAAISSFVTPGISLNEAKSDLVGVGAFALPAGCMQPAKRHSKDAAISVAPRIACVLYITVFLVRPCVVGRDCSAGSLLGRVLAIGPDGGYLSFLRCVGEVHIHCVDCLQVHPELRTCSEKTLFFVSSARVRAADAKS